MATAEAHPQAPHVTRYLANVDARLAELAHPDAKRALLDEQREKWLRRYEDFQLAIDLGDDTPANVTAWDFLDTISGLESRLAQIAQAA